MNFRPLQDWAVIKRSEAAEKTAGGIIIPESAKEKPLEGVVVAIGPGRYKPEKGKEKEKKKKFIPTVLKPGQRVIYQKYAEREIELGSEIITLVREEDILGTVEDYAITEKKTHALEEKREGSVAVREKAHVPMAAPPKVTEEKPPVAKKKAAEKKPPVKKTAKEVTPVKKTAVKKTEAAKKAVPEKQIKKATPKTAKKKTTKKVEKKPAAPKKKVRPLAKKSAGVRKTAKQVVAKKPAVKKTAPKKAVKVAPKKAAGKKTAVKKAIKKTGTKGRKR